MGWRWVKSERVSWMDHAKASKILLKNYEDGKSRAWLAQQIGITEHYVSLAMHRTKRRARDEEVFHCPTDTILKILEWEEKQWIR